jgi:transcriptional regulator with XRE-family HTH domain
MDLGLNGARVHACRIAAGLTVAALADRVGVHADVIWAIEEGDERQLEQLPVVTLVSLATAWTFARTSSSLIPKCRRRRHPRLTTSYSRPRSWFTAQPSLAKTSRSPLAGHSPQSNKRSLPFTSDLH